MAGDDQKLLDAHSRKKFYFGRAFFASFAHNDSPNHSRKPLLVLAAYRFKLHAHTFALSNEPDRGASPYFSVLNKKVKLNGGINRTYFLRLNKQAAYTQILYPGSVFSSPALPQDPDTLRRLYSFVVPSRLCYNLFQVAPARDFACRLSAPCGRELGHAAISACTSTVESARETGHRQLFVRSGTVTANARQAPLPKRAG